MTGVSFSKSEGFPDKGPVRNLKAKCERSDLWTEGVATYDPAFVLADGWEKESGTGLGTRWRDIL